jgi:hypothetical protein
MVNLEAEQARANDALRGLENSYVPLAVAAAVAFHQASDGMETIVTREDYEDALCMAAAALSRLAPVYQLRDLPEGRVTLHVDLTQRRFARGATELRGGNQPAARDLSIRYGDLQSALSLIKRAGVSFTFALSPASSGAAVDLGQKTLAPRR